jgi:hypothetical protein
MINTNNFEKIERINLNNKECLRFNFNGLLNQKEAVSTCNEWVAISSLDKSKKFVIIFNATKMVDYEPMTRAHFQNTMKELKGQIDQIWVISNSSLVRGGAAIMGMLTSFTVRAVDSEEHMVI